MTAEQIEIVCTALEEYMQTVPEAEWDTVNETLTAFYELLDKKN